MVKATAEREWRLHYLRWPQEATPVYDDKQGTIPFDQLARHAASVPEAERRDYMWIANVDCWSPG